MIGILTMSLGGHMGRYQSGEGATSMQHEPAFLVRYDASEIVVGKVTRVQRSYCLCDQDDKYHSRTCTAVKQKTAEHMFTHPE